MILFLLYFILINIVSFALFGIDKRKANHEKRRISEKTLLRSVGVGGRMGGVLGMTQFRHKVSKGSFLRKFWTISGIRLIVTIILMLLYR